MTRNCASFPLLVDRSGHRQCRVAAESTPLLRPISRSVLHATRRNWCVARCCTTAERGEVGQRGGRQVERGYGAKRRPAATLDPRGIGGSHNGDGRPHSAGLVATRDEAGLQLWNQAYCVENSRAERYEFHRSVNFEPILIHRCHQSHHSETVYCIGKLDVNEPELQGPAGKLRHIEA